MDYFVWITLYPRSFLKPYAMQYQIKWKYFLSTVNLYLNSLTHIKYCNISDIKKKNLRTRALIVIKSLQLMTCSTSIRDEPAKRNIQRGIDRKHVL